MYIHTCELCVPAHVCTDDIRCTDVRTRTQSHIHIHSRVCTYIDINTCTRMDTRLRWGAETYRYTECRGFEVINYREPTSPDARRSCLTVESAPKEPRTVQESAHRGGRSPQRRAARRAGGRADRGGGGAARRAGGAARRAGGPRTKRAAHRGLLTEESRAPRRPAARTAEAGAPPHTAEAAHTAERAAHREAAHRGESRAPRRRARTEADATWGWRGATHTLTGHCVLCALSPYLHLMLCAH